MDKIESISNLDYELLKEIYKDKIDDAIKKYENGYPIQYLIGYVDFYGYKINVDERVLIPRFETEGLVDETIKLIKNLNIEPSIVEIGTGSGCISIVLSKELDTHIDAIDISKNAIDLASTNAANNLCDINFYLGDIRNYEFNKKYNVLISNPPYVSRDEEVDPRTTFEPQNAIFAEDNGLEIYKVILDRSKEFLEEKNIICFEIGMTQGNAIKEYAHKVYPNSVISIKKDLSNRDRYLFIIND